MHSRLKREPQKPIDQGFFSRSWGGIIFYGPFAAQGLRSGLLLMSLDGTFSSPLALGGGGAGLGAHELLVAGWREGLLGGVLRGHIQMPSPGLFVEGLGGYCCGLGGVGDSGGEGGAFAVITCLCQESLLRLCRWGPCEGLARLCCVMAMVGVYSVPVMCWGLSHAV